MPERPLIQKEIPSLLRKGRIRIAVIGLGRIGLPTAAMFAKAGAIVTGVDLKKEVVVATNAGRCWLDDEPGLPDMVRDTVKSGKLRATTEAEGAISKADFIVICVPTPVHETKTPDYSSVQKASITVGRSIRKGAVVVIESTVGPGIVETMVGPVIEKESGLKAGKDFGLVSCPERSDPGNIMQNMKTLPRIIGGIGAATDAAEALYEAALGAKAVRVSDPKTANAAKLTENLFRDVNIALANEFALLFEDLGIDAIEVINACASKYNFMPHYPGIGVGGPCLTKSEFVFLATNRGLLVPRLGEFVDGLATNGSANMSVWGRTEFFVPVEPILTLSFLEEKTEFNRVSWFSRRPYQGKVMRIRLSTNRYVTVTPDHPMLLKTGNGMIMRKAREVRPGDEVPVSASYAPPFHSPMKIDLIEEIRNSGNKLISDTKVKPMNFKLGGYREYFDPGLRHLGFSPSKTFDCYRYNYLYLDKYMALERWQTPPIPHDGVLLYTARGHTCLVPAVYPMDGGFWRFIGYYASEGCVVESEQGRRTRERIKISFGQHEMGLINDCRSILLSWGIVPEEEIRDGSHSLRFSSRVFAFLLLDVLKCGHDSYSKRVPPQLFFSSRQNIAAFVQGLIRGDGHLENSIDFETRSMTQSYATSSPELFQGVLLLLQAFGLVPLCRETASKKSTVPSNELRIIKYEDLVTLERDVGGLPKLSLAMETYYRTSKRSPAFTSHGAYGTALVRSVNEESYSGYVYNMEVEGAHTFVTSFGIVTHNCLPANSYYLISEGVKSGNIPYLIRMSREINDRMPDHAAELVGEALNEAGKTVKGSRIAVLGVAYKPNIKDVQLTPVERVISRLQAMGARIEIYDPMFKEEEVFGIRVKSNLESAVRGTDCILIGTAHDEFKRLDLGELAGLARMKAGFVDARNLFPPEVIIRAGFAYRGVGRKGRLHRTASGSA